jgi:hypothetical protein
LAREHFSAEWIQFVIRNATNQGEMIPLPWNHLFGHWTKALDPKADLLFAPDDAPASGPALQDTMEETLLR